MFKKISNTVLSMPFFRWFIIKSYTQGVFWAIMVSLASVINDILMRFLGERLHPIETSFFRFFFSMISILPLIVSRGSTLFKTDRLMMHVLRAALGAVALGLCCYSVNIIPLSENTAIMFSEPLFFLPLAYFLLKEKVDMCRLIATVAGFIGLIIILHPSIKAFRVTAFIPIIAAILFALSNIMVKKMTSEHTSTMLFYFSIGTTFFTIIPLPFFWKTPALNELILLVLLGIGSNIIQICLFKAFSAADASSLAPFRYTEFIISTFFAYLLFNQIPTVWIFGGAAFIMLSTFYITIMETRKEKRKKKEACGNLKTFLTIIISLVLVSHNAEAKKAGGDIKKFSKDVSYYLKGANQGYANAQFNLGVCYEKGQGIPQDHVKAAKWYAKAANQGHAEAQFNLGICYKKGQGVPQDHVKAAKWYTKAANQGHAEAQSHIGFCYRRGEGVLQNYAKALEWIIKGVEQGNADAQANLGICYYTGQGVPQDYVKALEFYTKAANQGSLRAYNSLGYFYEKGQGVPQDYVKALEFYTKAANQGYYMAQWNCGRFYEKGQGVPQDYVKALEFYTKAANQGYAEAQFSLGLCYEKGQGVPQDYVKALEFYTKAANQGYAEAQAKLRSFRKSF